RRVGRRARRLAGLRALRGRPSHVLVPRSAAHAGRRTAPRTLARALRRERSPDANARPVARSRSSLRREPPRSFGHCARALCTSADQRRRAVTRSWLFIALAGVRAVALIPLAACHRAPPELVRPQVASVTDGAVPPRESFIPREPRLMPAETLIRSYTAIFGDLV